MLNQAEVDAFYIQMNEFSDQEIIETYNNQVGLKTFTNSRMPFLYALVKQMTERGWDCSAIADEDGMYFKSKVKLTSGKTIKPLEHKLSKE